MCVPMVRKQQEKFEKERRTHRASNEEKGKRRNRNFRDLDKRAIIKSNATTPALRTRMVKDGVVAKSKRVQD